jgi:hypothetical protein
MKSDMYFYQFDENGVLLSSRKRKFVPYDPQICNLGRVSFHLQAFAWKLFRLNSTQ